MSVLTLTERYFAERPALEAALREWKNRLRPIARGIDSSALVTGRVKTYRSVIGKAYRVPSSPRGWERFGDLVALKAVFPTARGVEAFTEWLSSQEQWEPVLDRKEAEPDKLQYQSMQFDLRAIDICDSHGDPLQIELQVRTAASDAWYIVDHRLQYKGMVELPSDLRRKLYRLIVLAELFDEEVEQVLARQVELPEYAVARLYDTLVRLAESLFDGHTRTTRPEGLLELALSAYKEDEIDTLEQVIEEFTNKHAAELIQRISRHLYGSADFVEARDWIYYEPETLLLAERAAVRPALLRNAIANSDFEDYVTPMLSEFAGLTGGK